MSAIKREVTIGPCRLILGDAIEVARELSDDWHAVVADPPYGINFLHSGGGRAKAGIPQTRFVGAQFKVLGDDLPYDPRPRLKIAGKRPVILWGGNHCASRLPDTGGWLAWQKLPDAQLGRLSFGDGEIALYSWNRRLRFKRHTWSGMTRAGSHALNGKTRFHPAQKPVEIMRWCIDMLPARGGGWGDTIIDPYLGSGSTAIAAMQAGVKFIGVEMSDRWFDVAVDRAQTYFNEARQRPCR